MCTVCIPGVLTVCSLAPPLIFFPLFIVHIPWVRSPGGQVGKALTLTLFLPEWRTNKQAVGSLSPFTPPL